MKINRMNKKADIHLVHNQSTGTTIESHLSKNETGSKKSMPIFVYHS